MRGSLHICLNSQSNKKLARVPRLVASASPGNLSEMKILQPHSRPTESETLYEVHRLFLISPLGGSISMHAEAGEAMFYVKPQISSQSLIFATQSLQELLLGIILYSKS